MNDASTDTKSAQESASTLVEISLVRTPLWSARLVGWVSVIGALALMTLGETSLSTWQTWPPSAEAMAVLGRSLLIASVAAIFVLRRLWARQKPLDPIRLYASHMTLPRHAEARTVRTIGYGDIMTVGEVRAPTERRILIETDDALFSLPQHLFVHPEGPTRLVAELRLRILNLPQGAARIAATEHLRRRARHALAKQAYCTQAILALMVIFFLNTWAKGALETPLGLLRWGANAPALVREGEWYRLVAANVLHSGFLHLGLNMMALWYVGNIVERLLGPARFVTIACVGGLIASLSSMLACRASLSIGASGMIFSLIGCFGVMAFRLGSKLPLGLRQSPTRWAWMLLLNLFLGLVLPMVDLAAHIGGLVAGMVLALLLIPKGVPLPLQAGPLIRAVGCAFGLIYLGGFAQAVVVAANMTTKEEQAVSTKVMQDKQLPASALIREAFFWKAGAGKSKAQLAAAHLAAQEAVRRAPLLPEAWAMLAICAWGDGELSKSFEAWHQALWLAEEHKHEPASLELGAIRNPPDILGAFLAELWTLDRRNRLPEKDKRLPPFRLIWDHEKALVQNVEAFENKTLYFLVRPSLGALPRALVALRIPPAAKSPFATPPDVFALGTPESEITLVHAQATAKCNLALIPVWRVSYSRTRELTMD